MFCDELKIKAIAGKGGDGAVSFRREKFVPRGGPDGGDGGNGGDIAFRVNGNLNTLGHLANRKTYHADDGVNGQKKKMHGKNAEKLILDVPAGTLIFNHDKSELLADLDEENKTIVVVRGGKGGLGNARFVSSIHQAPRFAEDGEPGEEKEIILELKLVADVGLIGLPSAGKSTLISVISNAKPKIAAYHFTTLVPNLGVVSMEKFGGSSTQGFVVADIPGLIEGASQGKGLGVQFLKHISRTKLLVHIIDSTLDSIGTDYKTINKELKEFDKNLAKTEQIVVLNKIDMLTEKELKKRVSEIKKVSKKTQIFPISGIAKKGLKELLFEVIKELAEIRKKDALTIKKTAKKEITILRPHLSRVKFEIVKIVRKKDHKVLHVTGSRIEQLAVMTDIKNPEGLERMYRQMDKLGIQAALNKKGATFGDIIKIKEKSIPYRK